GSRHNSRRSAVEAARAFRRSDAHAAEKWMQRNLDAGREFCDHALFIERNDFYSRVRKIVGKIPAARAERVVRVRNRKFYTENSYFEHVADFRAFDVDRASQNVPARPLVLHLIGDVAERLIDLLELHDGIFQPL